MIQRSAVLTAALAALAMPAAAQAQGMVQGQPRPATSAPPISTQPVPGELELSKLLWSTMVAIDQANQSGNYSVLRDISAPGFQINNDPTALANIFQGVRNARIDLSNALLVAPTYTSAPRIFEGDVLQVQGFFGLRPTMVQFDFQYQWFQGRWRLFGVSIRPAPMAQNIPGPPTAPAQQPSSSRNQRQRN